ncbi:SixA phosphatase family protein [Patulibacter minatonensis]|uniref:SixA phosphatase family protein n=1 Tax=Patulibacter minatonensis TaxID=298163 RepID=UPI000684CF0C|nr:histidine phosphatase family protein [Patulibacter minatonensis]
MSELLLLRHGTAEDRGPSGGDADRDLVAKGEAQARAAGVALAALGLTPDVVLASPKVRAWRTALLACEALGGAPVEHPAVVGLDRDEALLAAGLGDRVLVVGHEPDLSQTVHDLTGARIRMRKAAVAVIAVQGSRAELRALLGPDVLSRVRG